MTVSMILKEVELLKLVKEYGEVRIELSQEPTLDLATKMSELETKIINYFEKCLTSSK